MPVYEVTSGSNPPRLVEAKSRAAARAYASAKYMKVEKCSASRAHVLASRHVQIEDANAVVDLPNDTGEDNGE